MPRVVEIYGRLRGTDYRRTHDRNGGTRVLCVEINVPETQIDEVGDFLAARDGATTKVEVVYEED